VGSSPPLDDVQPTATNSISQATCAPTPPAHIGTGYGRLVVGVIRVGMLWSAEGATGQDLGDGPLQR
jgi:hypothetical protein